MDAYKEKLDPLREVAVKADENEVLVPGQDAWETVKCDSCHELFYIGPKHILEARTKPQDAATQLRSILGEDHRVGRSTEMFTSWVDGLKLSQALTASLLNPC